MKLLNQRPKNHVEALLALSLVHRLGIQRIRLLLQVVDHPAEIFAMPQAELKTIDGIGASIADTILSFDDWDQVDRLLALTRRAGARIISYCDDIYPPLLREIYDPPMLFWVRGDPGVLDSPGIAVVGTRRASRYGKDMAASFSEALSGEGLTIVSGLAFGVDAAAHRATLEAGGHTVAVLGSGIDTIYPEKHRGLAADMADSGGAVITEFVPGTPPDAGNFPVRNRIVSGLTLGTLVVESGLKGGSMLTAQSALTQNREVFVVPHALGRHNGEGCNHLIKRAAGKLVQNVGDILEELPQYQFRRAPASGTDEAPRNGRWKSLDLDEEARAICELLEKECMHIDDMSEALDVPSHRLLARLLELEMQQCVRQRAGKIFELL